MSSSTPAQTSVFLFRFRLLPEYACGNLNFDQIPVPPATAVCTRDVLALQLVAGEQELGALLLFAKDLGSALLDAHAYCSFPDLPSLDLTAESWLEVKGTPSRSTVFGYADASLELRPLVPGHADNRPFHAAASLLPTIKSTPGLGAAFADFRAARRQAGSYVAFFAFRVLEDIAYTFKNQSRKQAWSLMNRAFNTDEHHWKLLTDAGVAARHQPPSRQSLAYRNQVLGLAKEAIDRRLASLTQAGAPVRAAITFIASAVPPGTASPH